MCHYINKDAFLAWYRANAKTPLPEAKLMKKLYEDYCRTRKAAFCLGCEESLSGREESYPFSVETIGCCGASTVYITF